MRIVIIGAGAGGICMGIKLREAGFEDFVILEKAPQAGGTWWYNTYPGVECDVPSHLYCYSFALNKRWSRPYSPQPEILAYFQGCAERFGVMAHMRFGVEVCSARWSEEHHQWTLVLQDGSRLVADVVLSAMGMFNVLCWPQIEGLERFTGTAFHSARWRHDHDLRGRRVAVIGSAASAIQLVPRIAPIVEQLHLFQRTPNWVAPKLNDPFSTAALERLQREPLAASEMRLDAWRDFNAKCTFAPDLCRLSEKVVIEKCISVVADPALRARLTPCYPFGQKRPLRSSEYYPVFNRPNVELVTEGIEGVRGDTLITADGTARRVDTIIMATGFETAKFLSSIDVRGEGGRVLQDEWAEGAQAYLGVATAGYPNLFMLYGPNTNNGSIIYMIECQAAYVLRQLGRMRDESIRVLRVRQNAQDDYNLRLQQELDRFEVYRLDSTTPTYYRARNGRRVTQCPYNMPEYRELTDSPDPDAYDAIKA